MATPSSNRSRANSPPPADPAAEQVAAPMTAEEKRLSDAIKRYNSLTKEAGGPENLKKVFDLIGTDGFAPKLRTSEAEFKRAGELLEKQKLDLKLQDNTSRELGFAAKSANYGAKYLEQAWNIGSLTKPDNPATLDATKWAEIARTSLYFHGWILNSEGHLKRARFPAFQLKPTLPSDVSGIPYYETFDDSSLSIKETMTETERSVANNGFSSFAIQASISGGGYGASVAASGGYNSSKERAKSITEASQHKVYVATYNFPRVRVFLDKYNLEPTPGCAEYLGEIRRLTEVVIQSKDDVERSTSIANVVAMRDNFFDEYGHVFATNFLLGGQLHGSRSSRSIGATSDEVARDAMKVAASLSVEYRRAGMSAGGSVSGTHEDSTSSKSHIADTISNSSLTWSARGGNTLLCANPPEWANSVAGYSSWRVLEQDGIRFLPELISTLTVGPSAGPKAPPRKIWSDIGGRFDSIARKEYQAMSPVPPGNFMGFIRLETTDGYFVGWKPDPFGNKLPCLSLVSDKADACALQVLDADVHSESKPEPTLPQLGADIPLYLIPRSGYGRSPQTNNQIAGVFADDDGLIREGSKLNICRWSFKRKPSSSPMDFKTPWNGKANVVINDGDEVTLFCHSFRFGSYKDRQSQPIYYAPMVQRHREEANKFTLCVPDLKADTILRGLDELEVDTNRNSIKNWPLPTDDARRYLDKDLRRVLENPNDLRDIMRRYDRQQQTDSDTQILDKTRIFMGACDPDNTTQWRKLWWRQGNVGLFADLNPDLVDRIQKKVADNLVEWAKPDDANIGLLTFKVRFMDKMT